LGNTMVQIYERPPRTPSFGEQVARNLGAGVSQGLSQASDFANQIMMEKHKNKQRTDLINTIEGNKSPSAAPSQQDISKKFTEALSGVEQKLGRELAPQEVDQLRDAFTQSMQQDTSQSEQEQDPLRKAKQYAAANEPGLARVSTEEAKINEKRNAPEKEYQSKKAHDVLDKVALSKENLAQRRTDYKIAEQAIRQSPGDIGSTKNFLSDALHLPMLKTASGAAFSAAMKDAFINSIKQVPGVRPNQWIEQQVQSAMARIGQSDEANLNALALGNFKLDLEERYNEIVDALEDQYMSRGQNVPGTIGKEAYKLMKPYVEERQKELAYDMRVNFEKEQGPKAMSSLKTVPEGTPLTVEMGQVIYEKADENKEDALKIARNLGYSIPSESFLKKRGYITQE
jgi:hypothetical protein